MNNLRKFSTDSSLGIDVDSRKRASKACDRCKLKKVKCCGSNPCTRCQTDDAVCHFGATNRADVKPVSATRANQLEHQHSILIKALRLLWQRYSETIDGAESFAKEQRPSVHEMIRSLGLLEPGADSIHSSQDLVGAIDFEEEKMQTSSSEEISRASSAVISPTTGMGYEDMMAVDYSQDSSQQDQQSLNYWANSTLSTGMDDQSSQFSDLSMFDGFDFGNLTEQSGPDMFGTISNRRGQGNMPSLGVLPSFDLSQIAAKQPAAPIQNLRTGHLQANTSYGSRLGPQNIADAQLSALNLKNEDTMSLFTTLIPAVNPKPL